MPAAVLARAIRTGSVDEEYKAHMATFLDEAFRTDYYRIDITFNDDGSWTYVTRTELAIRGKTPAFDHRDTNTLRRVAAASPNPLVGRVVLESQK